MTSNSIQIHHFHGQYKVSTATVNAVAIQHRLDRIARELLARAWEDWLASADEYDETLYFIEQMEVNLALDLSQNDDREVAKAWVRALHQGILRTLSQHGSRITTFQNRSEFVASFLEELLRGNAWEKWYYQEFDPFKSLPFGQIARQVLTVDEDVGRDVLIELTRRGALALLLGNLTDGEVEAIVFQCLLPPSPRVVLPNTYLVWVQSLRFILDASRFRPTDTVARNLARLYLALLNQRPELGPDVNLARFIHDLLELSHVLRGLADRQRFLALVESDEATAIFAQLGRGNERQWLTVLRQLGLAPEQQWTIALRQLDRGSLQQLAALLREVRGSEVANLLRDLGVAASQPATSRLFSPYGGLFLIIPSIIELGLYEYLQRCPYPEPQDCPKAGVLLVIMALQCLGRENAEPGIRDRALALFAGLSALLELSSLETYTASITSDMHAAFHRDFQNYQAALMSQPHFSLLQRNSLGTPPEYFEALHLWTETNPLLGDRELDRSLAQVSGFVLTWFSTKLGAFASSSPDYLRRNFWESQAEIEIFEDRIMVHFLTCPLQMVLRMAGFDHNTWTAPWLEGRQLEFSFY